MSDFCHPFIADDSFDPSAYIGDIFFDQFQDAAVAKSGPLLSMSYEKVARRDMLGKSLNKCRLLHLLILCRAICKRIVPGVYSLRIQ